MRVEDAEVRTAAGDGFILGAVDEDLAAGVRPAQGDEVAHAVGAGHRAAHPAAVVAGVEEAAEHRLAQVGGFPVLAEAEIVGRQQVVVVHDGDDVRGADGRHLVLLGVEFDDLAGMLLGDRLQTFFFSRLVGVERDGGVPAGHQGPDALVGEDGAHPAAAGLLVAGALALRVVPAEVEAAEEGVLRAGAGRHHRDVARLALGEVLGQHLRELVGVLGQARARENLHLPVDAVHEHDDVLVGLAMDLEGVEARELEVGTEIAAHVGIDDRAGEGGDGGGDALAGARVGRGPSQRAACDADGVLRVVPTRRGRDGVPQQPEVEPLAADEELFHPGRHRFRRHGEIGEAKVQRLVGVALIDGGPLVGEGLLKLEFVTGHGGSPFKLSSKLKAGSSRCLVI